MKLHWLLGAAPYATTREGSPPEVGAIVEDRDGARKFRVVAVAHLLVRWRDNVWHEAEVVVEEVQA